jgi:hypothetical protein
VHDAFLLCPLVCMTPVVCVSASVCGRGGECGCACVCPPPFVLAHCILAPCGPTRVPFAAPGVAPTALAVSGPYLYAVLGALGTIVKVGTGFGASVRGKVYAHADNVLQRLVVEGGSALFSLDGAAGLWVGVAGATGQVLVRESTMKAGVFVAFAAADLSSAGVAVQTSSDDGSGEESKGESSEAAAKVAASVSTGAGSLIGLGASALAMVDDKTLMVCACVSACLCVCVRVCLRACVPACLHDWAVWVCSRLWWGGGPVSDVGGVGAL